MEQKEEEKKQNSATTNEMGNEWINPITESQVWENKYDQIADSYESVMQEMNYKSSTDGARFLGDWAPLDSLVLDAGCGTGLNGEMLKKFGFQNIEGIDISEKMLEQARSKNIYRSLSKADLQKGTDFEAATYDAISCIGVLAHIKAEPALREFIRITRPGGIILFSQRNDLVDSQDYDSMLDKFSEAGLWEPVFRSKDLPYLPADKNFADKIKVVFFVFRVK